MERISGCGADMFRAIVARQHVCRGGSLGEVALPGEDHRLQTRDLLLVSSSGGFAPQLETMLADSVLGREDDPALFAGC